MFKFITDLFSGRTEVFNETSSSDSHIDGFDQEGNYHHISKCGNMGIDTTTGDSYTDMGNGFIQSNTDGSMFHSTFDDDPFGHKSEDPFGTDPFGSNSKDPFNDDPFGHSSFGHHGFEDDF